MAGGTIRPFSGLVYNIQVEATATATLRELLFVAPGPQMRKASVCRSRHGETWSSIRKHILAPGLENSRSLVLHLFGPSDAHAPAPFNSEEHDRQNSSTSARSTPAIWEDSEEAPGLEARPAGSSAKPIDQVLLATRRPIGYDMHIAGRFRYQS